MKQIQEFFELPESVIPIALVAIGHTAEEKLPVDRFDDEIVRYDKWN